MTSLREMPGVRMVTGAAATRRTWRWAFLAGLISLAGSAGVLRGESRYLAETVAGGRWEGKELHDWHDPRAQPRLDNRKLFDEPLRWVMDTAMPPAAPLDACVELFGGDCLPGRVTGASDGTGTLGERYAPHVTVEPSIGLETAEGPVTGGIRVATKWLRRVVWQRRGDSRYRPGTVFFRDGRQVEFRSLRWGTDNVRLLVANETREVPFGQIAELHLPRIDPWESWLDQLAALCPEGVGQVVQVETGDGLRVTSSIERMRPATTGGGQRENWRHLIQPAWSDEPLWVRFRTVRTWRYFSPHEVPLTAIEPSKTVFKAALGGGWWPRVDRNVQGGPLQTGTAPQGWGLGVHAHSEVEYLLSPLAKTFRARCGLDQVVGQGGCVKATVAAGVPGSAPLFETPVLIGAAELRDTGVLSLALAENAPRRLLLAVDPVAQGRPAGADPLEVRDVFDWHQPLLELDVEPLKLELQKRAFRSVPFWNDWTLVAAETSPVVLRTLWDPFESRANHFGTLIAPRAGAITVTRKWALPAEARYLMLRINRPEKKVPVSTVQVRIDGKSVVEFPAGVRHPWGDPDPALVPISDWAGRTVTVEISQLATEPEALVEWRLASTVTESPLVRRVFEDEAAFVDDLVEGEALARIDTDDRQRGTASLKLTPGEKGAANLFGLVARIRESPRLGEYRFIRFAWKTSAGAFARLHLASDGQWGSEDVRDQNASLRYSTGRGGERVRSVPIERTRADEWQVVIRDLYGDFGAVQLTGLKLEAGGEGAVNFDSIHLARRREDLERMEARVDDPFLHLGADVQKNLMLPIHNADELSRSIAEFAPAFSCSTIGWEGLWLLKEYRGRQKVLRTAPPNNEKPGLLRAPCLLPKDQPSRLRAAVAPHDDRSWQLEVAVNGQVLHEAKVSHDTVPKDGWLDVDVDLSRFAGQNVLIELRQKSQTNAFGYWSHLEVGP